MLGHLLRTAWRRRRLNGLVAAEIGGSFLVLSIVTTIALQFLIDWRRPLGFDGRDVWIAEVHGQEAFPLHRLLAAARTSGDVLVAAAATTTPYQPGEDSWHLETPNGLIDAEHAAVTDDALEAWGLEVVDGRWFRDGDGALGWRPVVVDMDFARAFSPDGSVVGRSLPTGGTDHRVIGVIRDFRRRGELSRARPYFVRRMEEDAEVGAARLVLKMQPGTRVSAEPALLKTLQAAAPGRQVGVTRLQDARATELRASFTALGAAGVVASFLLVMVALGLVGVLWQNVARRRRELGLRRALGATPEDLRLLVVGEVLAVAGLAILVGAALGAQAHLLGLVPVVGGGILALGMLASALVVGAIVLACSLHPGSLAMRVAPAEALRQE